jgi:hypothetical protein
MPLDVQKWTFQWLKLAIPVAVTGHRFVVRLMYRHSYLGVIDAHFREEHRMEFLKRFCRDERGDMAEKAVVMAAIIIGAYAVWQLLGNRIAGLVSEVAGAI